MARLSCAFIVVIAAILAVWSMAQVASATAMSVEMALSAQDDMMGMTDCNRCDSDHEDGLAKRCEQACAAIGVLQLLTGPADDKLIRVRMASLQFVWPVLAVAERASPPEPPPPRVLALI